MHSEEPRALVADGVEIPTTRAAIELDENVGSKILSGGIWRTAAYGFATLAAIASTSVVSREIGPADFAAFTTALSLLTIAMSLSDFGLLSLGVREYAALEGHERERSLRALITLRLGFSIIGAIGVVIVAIASDFPDSQVVGLIAASIGLVILSLYVSFNVPLQATYRLNVLAALDAARQGVHSILIVLAAVLVGSVGLIVGTLLPVAIMLATASWLLVRKMTPIAPSWDMSKMRELVADVGTFALAASIGTIYASLAQVVSYQVLSKYEAGQFALAFRIYAVMLGAALITVAGAFPLLVTTAKEDLDRLVYATRRLIQTTALAGIAGTVALVTGAAFAVAVLGGPKFDGAVEMIAIISLGLPATFVLVTGTNVLLATRRHRELLVVSVGGAVVSVAITWLLALQYEGRGAAAGIAIGEALIAAGYLVVIHRIDKRALPALRWWLGALVAGALGCAVALTSLPALAAAIVGLVITTGAMLALRLLPPEIVERIPGPWSSRAEDGEN